MDTTENYTKRYYPAERPAKAGVPYTTDLGELVYYVGFGAEGSFEGSFESKNGVLPTWFMEPSPMEVKDAEAFEKILKNNITIAMEGEGRVIFDYKVASKLCAEFSQLQPPVISAPDFLKEKGISEDYVIQKYNPLDVTHHLSKLLTEYLQRQGHKTNPNKL